MDKASRANVVFAYSPKNDDELELKVGDKIELIGEDEDGWYRGKLHGRIGVFPTNFVEPIEDSSPGPQSLVGAVSQNSIVTDKLNRIFGNASNRSPRASLNITNFLPSDTNSNSSNGNHHSSTTNNNSNSNNSNLVMNNNNNNNNNNTQEASEDPAGAAERRPKPIRGFGYGDIFASGAVKPKPLPADPPVTGSLVSERLSAVAAAAAATSLSAAALQKQIPRKPPPPAPIVVPETPNTALTSSNSNLPHLAHNGTSNDQAPALPPKPANQFSPLSVPYTPRPPLPPLANVASARHIHSQHQQQPQHHHQQQQQQPQLECSISSSSSQQQQPLVREQARALFEYKPEHADELAMAVGDIVTIIDKNIEDSGWWKAELRGKVGVIPDNFVQLIDPREPSSAPITSASSGRQPDWHRATASSANQLLASNFTSNNSSNHNSSNTNSTEGKLKSVFAATPKGFSKELENNLEKQHSNPVSFLSLKRNKLQQLSAQAISVDESMLSRPMNGNQREDAEVSSTQMDTTKLNHIIANRAKGPARKPPSSILNKRNQSENSQTIKSDSNGRDDSALGSLPISQSISQDTAPSLSQDQSNNNTVNSIVKNSTPTTQSTGSSPQNESNKPNDTTSTISAIKSSLSLENVIDKQQSQFKAPKTSQRGGQQAALDKSKSTTPQPATTAQPQWMVELKKAQNEKKRDTPSANHRDTDKDLASVSTPTTTLASTNNSSAANAPISASPMSNSASNNMMNTITQAPTVSSNTSSQKPMTVIKGELVEKFATDRPKTDQVPFMTSAQYDEIVKQISKNVSSEISQLREEVRRLQLEENDNITELRNVIEVLKAELRVCKSATESQKRYIKDLVNNLADERKKIASMQVEIDRNLK